MVCCSLAAGQIPWPQRTREVRALGCFTNVKGDGEHATGYSAKLWVTAVGIIGMIDHPHGLTGDPPMGVLTNVDYDVETGKLYFDAKLTAGLHYCRKHKKGVPSNDLLVFHGFLKEGKLEGDIVLEDRTDATPIIVDKRENFLMRRDDSCILEDFERYDIWRWYWEPVFKSRGPKW